MKITKALMILLILIACAAAVSAQVDPAPTISITAMPGTTVTNSVTIRASARDTSTNAGIDKIELYLNNNLLNTKQCGYSTSCILSQPRLATQPKNETFHAIAYDRIQSTTSSNLTVTFLGPNTPPNMTLLPNATSINEDSGYNNLTDLWNHITDTWTAPQNMTYNIIAQTNTSMANCFITNNRWFECNTTTQDAFGSTIVTIQASDGQLTKQKNVTVNVLPVNDAPVFNTTIPAITFAEDTTYTFNISDHFYDVDNAVSSFSFLPASTGNITITYAYNNTLNKIQATLTPAANWNGAVTTNFTANDGTNSSGPSNNVLITVTPVNDAPQFDINSFNCGNMYTNIFFSCDINATDIDTGDILTYYDNTTMFNIDLTTGWLNFTPNSTGNYSELLTVCDDSGAANNCTSIVLQFTIYPNPTVIFMQSTAIPSSPTNYNPNSTHQFQTEAAVAYQIGVPYGQEYLDKIWLEFNGTNYTVNITYGQLNHTIYYVNFTPLAAGNYTYRWHGNMTPSGLHFNSSWYNYLINRADPQLVLTIPNNWTYGTPANVSCTVNTTQVTPVLMRNGTIVSNPDNITLGAGTYTYFCYVNQTQNYTAANATGNMTVLPVQTAVTLNVQTPITYGTAANVTCNASPSAITPTLTRNGVPLTGLNDTSVLGAGNYTYVCYYNTTQNYIGSNATKTLIVNPMPVTVNLNMQTPINYGTAANVTCNASPSNITPTLTRNGVPLTGLNDTSVLGAGNYTYVCYYNTTQNYIGDNETQMLVVNKIAPVINLTLNGQANDLSYPANQTIPTTVIITGSLTTPTSGYLALYINNTFNISSTTGTTGSIFYPSTGTVPITLKYNATQNYTQANLTRWIFFGTALQILGINKNNGSTVNSPFNLNFTTNKNTTCKWSLNNINYSSMNNTFTTTGQTIHSTMISFPAHRQNDIVYLSCFNDTQTNRPYTYYVDNIIENSNVDGSSTTTGSIIRWANISSSSAITNSTLYHDSITSSSVSNSSLNSSTITGSTINGSTLVNCTVINSTVKNYNGRNCQIVNAFLDPNPPYYIDNTQVTGGNIMYSHLNRSVSYYSNITNSTVFDSNIQYSSLNNSNVTQNSYVFSSTLTGCDANNADMRYMNCSNSNVTNSQLYNVTLINAVVTNGMLTSGIIIRANGSNYSVPPKSPNSIANITNLPPNASFNSPNSIRRNRQATFTSTSTDPNPLDTINTLNHTWNFGDGSNGTGVTTSHAYSATGTYNITLTVTDSQGAQDTAVRSITVTASTGGGSVYTGGGGGGGGGGSAYYSSTWKVNLDERPMDIRTMGRIDKAMITAYNTTHTMRMTGINRQQVNFTIDDIAYSVPNFAIQKINLDTNTDSDLRITVLNNYYTRAQIRFDKIKEPMDQQTVPFITGSLANMGLDEEESIIEQQIEEEQETKKETLPKEKKEKEEKQEEEIQEEPIDNKVIGLGITAGVVVAGLIIYFLFSLILL